MILANSRIILFFSMWWMFFLANFHRNLLRLQVKLSIIDSQLWFIMIVISIKLHHFYTIKKIDLSFTSQKQGKSLQKLKKTCFFEVENGEVFRCANSAIIFFKCRPRSPLSISSPSRKTSNNHWRSHKQRKRVSHSNSTPKSTQQTTAFV